MTIIESSIIASHPMWPGRPKHDWYEYLATLGFQPPTLDRCVVREAVVTGLSSRESVKIRYVREGQTIELENVPVWIHTDIGTRLPMLKGVEQALPANYFKDAALMFPFPEDEQMGYKEPKVLILCDFHPEDNRDDVHAVIHILQNMTYEFATDATPAVIDIALQPTYKPYVRVTINASMHQEDNPPGFYDIPSINTYLVTLYDLIDGAPALVPVYDEYGVPASIPEERIALSKIGSGQGDRSTDIQYFIEKGIFPSSSKCFNNSTSSNTYGDISPWEMYWRGSAPHYLTGGTGYCLNEDGTSEEVTQELTGDVNTVYYPCYGGYYSYTYVPAEPWFLTGRISVARRQGDTYNGIILEGMDGSYKWTHKARDSSDTITYRVHVRLESDVLGTATTIENTLKSYMDLTVGGIGIAQEACTRHRFDEYANGYQSHIVNDECFGRAIMYADDYNPTFLYDVFSFGVIIFKATRTYEWRVNEEGVTTHTQELPAHNIQTIIRHQDVCTATMANVIASAIDDFAAYTSSGRYFILDAVINTNLVFVPTDLRIELLREA